MVTEAEARDSLGRLIASGTFPTVTSDELGELLASARIADRYGFIGDTETQWAPETAYEVDDLVVPPLRDGWIYVCKAAGTSGETEPAWGTTGEFTDGTVTWEIAYGGWEPTHDMNRAAVAGWELKAGRVTDRTSFSADGSQFNPQQVFDHCMKMADLYRNKISDTIQLAPPLSSDDWAADWTLPRA